MTKVRAATAEDVPTLLRLIRELAEFEKAPDAVLCTEADLLRDGFDPQPKYEALIGEADGAAAGFVMVFTSYSSWLGRPGLYIHDLYVSPLARGRGLGGKLVAEVAKLAVARGHGRVELNVLDWNPARAFYAKLGLAEQTEWLVCRAEGESLHRLAGLAE